MRMRHPDPPWQTGCWTGSDDQVEHVDSGEVSRAFEMLTQEQRDVISLRAVGGLTVEQTAEVVGRSVPTVKQAQRTAVARLARSSRLGVMPL